MTLPKWDDDMKFELLRLKSELRPDSFRALHAPIGLGRLIAVDPSEHQKPQHKTESLSFPITAASQNISPSLKSKLEAVPALPPLPMTSTSSFPRRLTKIILIHALDIGFVVMTIALGLLLASWLIDPGHMSDNPELLKQATPLRFLLETKMIVLVLGLYGFFSFYWLFFKLVSGSTLGESFLDNFWSLQNPRKTLPVNDSRDS